MTDRLDILNISLTCQTLYEYSLGFLHLKTLLSHIIPWGKDIDNLYTNSYTAITGNTEPLRKNQDIEKLLVSALKDTIKGYDPNSADIHVNVYGICSMRFVEPIKCLSSMGYIINPDFALSIAIKDKNYKLFNFIHDTNPSYKSHSVCYEAAKTNDLNMIKFVFGKKRYPWSEYATQVVVDNEYYKVYSWVFANVSVSENIVKYIIQREKQYVLSYLIVNGLFDLNKILNLTIDINP
jgi:hypothetical protein